MIGTKKVLEIKKINFKTRPKVPSKKNEKLEMGG
jgi:hypothetical protein